MPTIIRQRHSALHDHCAATDGALRQERLNRARSLSAEYVDALEHSDSCSPEELRMLLYKRVDDVYRGL